MRFSLIPFLFLIVPILEIAVFIVIGGQIGLLYTAGLILVTAIIGTILLRVQGFQVLAKLQQETNAGRIPGKELGHGAMILVAGVLLLTPGFVTDTVGFLLFVPPVRSLIWSFLASRVNIAAGSFGTFNQSSFDPNNPFDSQDQRRNQTDDGVVDLGDDEYRDLEDSDGEIENLSKSNPNSPWKK